MNGAPRLGGAVLAGGASRRMGVDKALIEIDGVALVRRAVDALAAAGADPVVVVGGDTASRRALGLRTVEDRWPGEGPLGGMISALDAVPADIVVVVSCDLVEPSPDAVTAVVAALGDSDVAVPVVDGRAQWMHAAWHRRCLPALQRAFDGGVRAPRRAVDTLTVAEMRHGTAEWFRDVDTPGDLRRASSIRGDTTHRPPGSSR